jgi:hypothetical protein
MEMNVLRNNIKLEEIETNLSGLNKIVGSSSTTLEVYLL